MFLPFATITMQAILTKTKFGFKIQNAPCCAATLVLHLANSSNDDRICRLLPKKEGGFRQQLKKNENTPSPPQRQ
jgi:hypothetical protein